MSGLWTLSSSWPFLTLSSRRALISTTRPLAIEITGTSRAMSGKTVPVAVNSEADSIWPAVASGNLAASLPSIVIRFMSATWITCAGGGAPSPASLPLHPERTRSGRIARPRASQTLGSCFGMEKDFIGLPRVPLQDSVVRRRSGRSRSVVHRPVVRSGSRSAR